MRVLRFLAIVAAVGCHEASAPVVTLPLECAPGSVVPSSFVYTVDPATSVVNRVTLPHRTADTIWVFDGTTAVILAKSGGRCQTLFDSLLARHQPPIVRAE